MTTKKVKIMMYIIKGIIFNISSTIISIIISKYLQVRCILCKAEEH